MTTKNSAEIVDGPWSPKGDTGEAIGFLEQLRPDGWQNIVAIDPDTPAIAAITRKLPEGRDDIRRFVDQWQGKRGIYYMPNEPTPGAPDKKLTKKHVANVCAVFADIDPSRTEDFEAERGRLNTLSDEVHDGPLAPSTFWIDSGGGHQHLWLLQSPLPAAEFADQAEAIGRGIAAKLGGDAVQSIDHVLRLPGTVNLPNEKKRARGQRPAKACVRGAAPKETHTLDDLASAFPAPATNPKADREDGRDVQDRIDWGGMAAAYEDLDENLRKRFEAACEDNETLQKRWGGDASGQQDTSGSGLDFALAYHLHRAYFDEQETAQMMWLFEHGSKHGERERQIARAIARNGAVTAADEFDPVSIPLPDPNAAKAASWRPHFWQAESDPASLPRRRFLLGSTCARGYVTALIAAPGAGKTSYGVAAALALASGRDDLLGMKVHESGRVWLFNGEDDATEIERRLHATAQLHEVDRAAVRERVLVTGAGEDASPFMLARRDPSGQLKRSRDVDKVIEEIVQNAVAAFIVDPLVELHEGDENNNGEMRLVLGLLREIAKRTNCAVIVAHHTRKPAEGSSDGHEGNMHSARGAGAIAGAVRFAYTLTSMSEKDGKAYAVDESDRRSYVQLVPAKANLVSRGGEGQWFRLEGVALANGDNVGAVKFERLVKARDKAADGLLEHVAEILAHSDAPASVLSIASHLVEKAKHEPMLQNRDGLPQSKDTYRRKTIDALADPKQTSRGLITLYETEGENGSPVATVRLDTA